MTFLQPWWWALALLALPLLFWHARNPRALRVPSLQIWRAIAPEVTRSTLDARRFQWRPDRSLWVHLLALAALVLALTGPRPAGSVADHHVWIVDRTASMGAPHGDSSRWEAALARAERALEVSEAPARGGPVVSVVTVGSDLAVPYARGTRPRSAVDVLRASSVEVARGEVNVAALRDLVDGLLAAEERTRLTVLTDGPGAADIDEALTPWDDAEDVTTEVATFGEAEDTHGFASVRAVRMASDESSEGASWRIEGEVVAYPPPEDSWTVRARYARAGTEGSLPWEEIQVRPSGERTGFSFETQFPGPGVLTLRLPEDVLPEDDVARVAVRDAPVPLRVSVAGEVPQRLVDALAALDGAEVDRAASTRDASGANAYDLGVVGPGAPSERPTAATVLWLGGAGPDEASPESIENAETIWSGGGAGGWSGIEDVPSDALSEAEVFDVGSGGEGPVLLRSAGAPLLRVESVEGRTDVRAAWAVGSTAWARELGFARFVTELAVAAAPRHGAWTDARCFAGSACRAAPDGRTTDRPGVYEADGVRWTVDAEAAPEVDLTVSGDRPVAALHANGAWGRFDRSLAAVAALLLAFDAFRAWRRRRVARREVGRARHWASVGLRGGAAVAVMLMATGVPAPTLEPFERAALVVDPRAWTDGDATDPERRALEQAARRAETVVRTDGAGQVVPSSRKAVVFDDPNRSDPVGYDLRTALELGVASLGDRDGRLIVAGIRGDDALRAGTGAEPAVRDGITVDLVPPPSNGADEAWVEGLDLPASVSAGDSVTVRVKVEGAGAPNREVRVEVDGTQLEAAEATGRHAFTWEVDEPGVHEVRAELVGDDPAGLELNDAMTELVAVEPAARVAVVAREEAAGSLGERLTDQGFETESWLPRDVPASVEGFLDVDLVILSDVPAGDLHPSRQESLERWVREFGGGLVLAGAEDAFGPGGYLRTPLEDLSPLSARVPGEQPQASIAFVLDRSGSMQQRVEGISRLALTKQATAEAVDLLHPQSEVAIVVFDDEAHLLKPLGPPDDVAVRLEPVTAGGGTNLYPALEAALGQLRGTEADARHMIVMTDGLSQNAPFGSLIEDITAADITISTVAVGRGADTTLLRDMARSGGGVYHSSEDVRALPSILSQEAMLLSSNPVREGSFAPSLESGQAAFLEGLPDAFPELAGYVRTTPKPEAEVHARTADGDAILASWRHGVGRVVSVATPLQGDWADAWMDTAFADDFLRNVVPWSAAPILRPGLSVDVRRQGDALSIAARVVDDEGRPVEGERVVAGAEGPDGRRLGPVLLADLGRGAYTGRLDAFDSGRYDVHLEVQGGDGGDRTTAQASAYVSYPSSLGFGTDRVAAVSQLARATGGRVALDASEPLVARSPALSPRRSMGPWAWLAVAFVAIALALDAMRVHTGVGAPAKPSVADAGARAATRKPRPAR